MSLAQKATRGIAWVVMSTIVIRILGFITSIVLARLLVPEDFGLFAIGLLAINTMGLFRDLGFGAALIYQKDDSKSSAANTAFILLPVVASIFFVIAYLSAPYISIIFDNDAVEPIIQVLALTFVISSIGTVPSMLLEKELEFKKKVLPDTLPQIGYALLTIGLALKGYGVWSLVYGQILSAVLTAGLIWIISKWRPVFRFDKKVALEMFKYSKHILGASFMVFITLNIDQVIIGRILGIEALGFYALAYTIANLPSTQITQLVSRIMFPVYSKLQDDKNALRSAYLKVLSYVSMIAVPMAFGIFVIAPDFVKVVLGEKWMPAVPVLQVLTIAGLIRSIAAVGGFLFTGSGRADLDFKMNTLKLAVMAVTIYPLTISYGILGTATSILFGLVAIIPFWLKKSIEITNIRIFDFLKTFIFINIGAIMMSVCVWGLLKLFGKIQITELLLIIIIGIIIYTGYLFAISKIFKIESINELWSLITH